MRIVKLVFAAAIALALFGCREKAKLDPTDGKASGAPGSAAAPAMAASAFAAAAKTDGMTLTGEAVRTRSAGAMSVDVYSMRHFMKTKPASKSKQAVIEADVDKMATIKMLRTIDAPRIKKGVIDAFELNGYKDTARINQYVAAFGEGSLNEGSSFVIRYDATAKSLTISVENGRSATVDGVEFMRAIWTNWFGKNDQASFGDDLIAKL